MFFAMQMFAITEVTDVDHGMVGKAAVVTAQNFRALCREEMPRKWQDIYLTYGTQQNLWPRGSPISAELSKSHKRLSKPKHE